jgi:hypothetical protein
MRTLTTAKNYTSIDQDMAEAIFYAKKFYFSYSSMNMLLWSPASFYGKYVMKMEEEDKLMSYLIQGKVIHCLLLDNKSFDKHFIVSPGKIPTGNERKVVDMVFYSNFDEMYDPTSFRKTLNDFQQEILDVLVEINLHQKLADEKATKTVTNPKSGNTKRLEKIVTLENLDYWEFLMKRGKEKKDIIDQATLDYCEAAVDIIKYSPNIMELLGMNITDLDNKDVYNEEYMEAELSAYDYGIKGFLDNVVVDHDQRIIFINDLKTTSKELKDFKESIEFYRYWLQAGVYIMLALTKFKPLVKSGYKFKFHFVVIDQKFQVYPFPVSEATISEWAKKTQEIFNRVDYHYSNRRFDLPYEFDLGQVVL